MRRRLQAHKLRDKLTDLPIAVVGKVIDLLNRNCVDIIVDTIRAAEDRFSREVGLGLFDTFAKGIAAGGGDEDKARDQNIVHANMRRVFDRGCHIHILGIGHTGKDETKGERGSNARRADVDLQVQLTGDLVKVATVIKGNDQPEGLLTSFRLEPFDFGLDEDNDLFQTFIVSPEIVGATERPRQKTSDKQKRALEALIEVTLAQGREPPAELGLPRDVKAVSAQAWMEELLRANVLDQKAKNPSARFGELRTSLAARYMIGTRDDLVWLARPPSPYARPARASGATASNSGSERIAPITLEERDALKRRGFSDDELFDLSARPQYARDILADQNRTPDTERFRVVGEVMKNTPCLVCGGSNNGVKLIKDTRQGGKPMPLHPRCAPDWYENKDPPL